MGLGFPEITVTTVIRWILRVLLVMFLMWLVQKRKQQEEEEENEEDEGEAYEEQQRQQQQSYRNRQGMRDRDGYDRDRQYPRARNNAGTRRNAQEGSYASGNTGASPGGLNLNNGLSKLPKPKPVMNHGDNAAAGGAAGEGAAELIGFISPLSSYPSLPLPTPKARPALNLKEPGGRSKRAGRVEDQVLNAHSRPITHLEFNEDGTRLFTCGKDKLIIIWSLPEGECLGKCTGHHGALWACSVTKDSKWLVSCGADRLVIVWDAQGTPKKLGETELAGVAKSVAWARAAEAGAADAARFATCSNKFGKNPASLGIWDFDGSVCTKRLAIEEPELPGAATQVCWCQGDTVLASCHESGEVMFWNSEKGTLLERLQAHEGAVSCINLAQDHSLMVSCGRVDMEVHLWDIGSVSGSGSDGASSVIRRHKSDRALNCVAVRPSLQRDEALGKEKQASDNGTDHSGFPCQVIAGGGQDARDVALVGNSSEQFETLLFRACAKEQQDLVPYAPEPRVRGHFGPIHTLAFSPDGASFASGSEDGCVRLHKLLAPGTGAEAAPSAAAEKEADMSIPP